MEIDAYDALSAAGIGTQLPGHYGKVGHTACLRLYKKVFPTIFNFIDSCIIANLKESDLIDFGLFADYMMMYLPSFSATGMRDYVFTSGRFLRDQIKLPAGKMDFRQILSVIWKDDRIGCSPCKSSYAFARPARFEGGEWKYYTDDNNMPFLCFHRDGVLKKYFEYKENCNV